MGVPTISAKTIGFGGSNKVTLTWNETLNDIAGTETATLTVPARNLSFTSIGIVAVSGTVIALTFPGRVYAGDAAKITIGAGVFTSVSTSQGNGAVNAAALTNNCTAGRPNARVPRVNRVNRV